MKSDLSINWWLYKYDNRICCDCKSYQIEMEQGKCRLCNNINSSYFWLTDNADNFKDKDEYCKFCSDELKHIKAGKTPCPLENTEGLLL